MEGGRVTGRVGQKVQPFVTEANLLLDRPASVGCGKSMSLPTSNPNLDVTTNRRMI